MASKKVFGKTIIHASGTTFEGRQGKLWNVRKHMKAGKPIITMLRREAGNSHDPNAIAILVKTGATVAKIGYVPACKAYWLAPKMDAGLTVRAYGGQVIGATYSKNCNLGFTCEIIHQIPATALAVAQEEA